MLELHIDQVWRMQVAVVEAPAIGRLVGDGDVLMALRSGVVKSNDAFELAWGRCDSLRHRGRLDALCQRAQRASDPIACCASILRDADTRC